MPDPRPTISFVVPALNEEDNIERTVGEVTTATGDHFLDYEVLLVDDGSTDRTGAIMDQLAALDPRFRVLHNPKNIGLGASYKRGVGEAKHEYVMGIWGDNVFPAASLAQLFGHIGEADVIVPFPANLKEIKTPARYVTSRGYTTLVNLITGLRLQYFHGMSIHRRDIIQALAIDDDGFGFQAEILVKLIAAGHSFREVGVVDTGGAGTSRALRIKTLIGVARTLALLRRESRPLRR